MCYGLTIPHILALTARAELEIYLFRSSLALMNGEEWMLCPDNLVDSILGEVGYTAISLKY